MRYLGLHVNLRAGELITYSIHDSIEGDSLWCFDGEIAVDLVPEAQPPLGSRKDPTLHCPHELIVAPRILVHVDQTNSLES